MRDTLMILTALALAFLVSSLVSGCGCLTANAYDKPACQRTTPIGHSIITMTIESKNLSEASTARLVPIESSVYG